MIWQNVAIWARPSAGQLKDKIAVFDKNKIKTAPDFAARDSNGREIKLSDFKSKKNVVLVFNRGFQ